MKIWLMGTCLGLAAALAAAQEVDAGTEADVAAIRQLQADWNAAVEQGSIKGYLAVLDADVELMPTDAPAIRGRDNYGRFLQPVFKQDRYEVEVLAPSEIEVSGDIAYARYDYIIHRFPSGSDEPVSSRRKFLDVLRRQEDGSWRVLKHIWNYNEPGVTP